MFLSSKVFPARREEENLLLLEIIGREGRQRHSKSVIMMGNDRSSLGEDCHCSVMTSSLSGPLICSEVNDGYSCIEWPFFSWKLRRVDPFGEEYDCTSCPSRAGASRKVGDKLVVMVMDFGTRIVGVSIGESVNCSPSQILRSSHFVGRSTHWFG